MATCEHLGCRKRFERKRPWQRFCSSSCRSAQRNIDLKDTWGSGPAAAVLEAALNWYNAEGRFEEEAILRERLQTYSEDTLKQRD